MSYDITFHQTTEPFHSHDKVFSFGLSCCTLGGDYKWARGFDPVIINSAHYIRDAGLRKAVSEYVDFENTRNIAIFQLLREQSAVGGISTISKSD